MLPRIENQINFYAEDKILAEIIVTNGAYAEMIIYVSSTYLWM